MPLRQPVEPFEFPRSNDLGLFAEFTFANIVAGLVEPSREPAMRLANRPARASASPATSGRPGIARAGGGVRLGPPAPAPRAHPRAGRAGFEAARVANDGGTDALAAGARSTTAAGASVNPRGGRGPRGRADPRGRRAPHAAHRGRRDAPLLCGGLRADGRRAHRARAGPRPRRRAPEGAGDPAARAASTWGGIVEVDDAPRLSSSVTVTLRSEASEVVVADLFLLSYG